MPLPFTYRLGVDAHGTHGYEIVEIDPENIMDPNSAKIVDRVMDQQDAAAKTTWYNCGGPGSIQPLEARSAPRPAKHEDDDDHPAKRKAHK